MTSKSLIIIGAGLSGLSTGCYAQINGFNSKIFERNSVPGGVASCWKRGEYLIDGGIHFNMGYKPGIDLYKIFKEVGIHKTKHVDMDVYGEFIDEAKGKNIKIHKDLDKLQNELIQLFPKDVRTIKQIIKGSSKLAEIDISLMGYEKPSELMTLWDKIRMMGDSIKIANYMFGKFGKSVRKYSSQIQDPLLRDLLMYMFLPDVPVWFILMILGLLSKDHMGLIAGGSYDLVKTIEKRYLNLKGEVSYRSDVEEILVENNRAIGVRLANGNTHFADYVISSADGYHTIFELLSGKYINEKIENDYQELKMSPPLLVLSYGIKQEFFDEPWMQLIKLKEPLNIANENMEFLFIRIFNYSSAFAPSGKTVIQVEFETSWNYWSDLRENLQEYKNEKKRIAEEVMNILEKFYPNISSKVEVTDIATPSTYYRYTKCREGSCMGWMPSSKRMLEKVEKTLPGLENFYLAGQWAMQTGGVQSSILSGRHALQMICKQEKQEFKTS